MVTIIRDRVRDLKDAGMTLDQIKAASPARGYTRRYGADSGPWTDQHSSRRSTAASRKRSSERAAGCRSCCAGHVRRVLADPWCGCAQARGAAPPPPTARASAPIDLTGYWVAFVTEDWRFRMVTPPKGDYRGVPITKEALQIVNAWDPAADEAAGKQCKSYGAGGHHARARATPRHLAGRRHAAPRHRCRHADAAVPVRPARRSRGGSRRGRVIRPRGGNGRRPRRSYRRADR